MWMTSPSPRRSILNRSVVLAGLLLHAACPVGATDEAARRPPRAGSRGSAPEPDEPRELRVRSAAPAPRYDERAPARLEGIEAEVYRLVTTIAGRVGMAAPSTDDAVTRATRMICRGLPRHGPPPVPLVEFALRVHGIVDPPPHFVIAAVPEGGDSLVLEGLQPRLETLIKTGNYARIGIGAAKGPGGERRVTLALLESRVRFRPLPRALGLGARLRVELDAAAGWRSHPLQVADPQGSVSQRALTRIGDRHGAPLACERRGVYQVEVTGEGAYGPEVLANFPVYCGVQPPREVRYPTESEGIAKRSVDELEREVHERTNKIRREHNLPVLRWNAAVSRVARAHSVDMAQARFVGHVSPTTGTPSDRLRRAKIIHLVARENVARAYSVGEVMSELMKSPAHRGNLIARDVTELGVGIAVERGSAAVAILVTQNFIRPGTAYNAGGGPAQVRSLIQQARVADGLGALAVDPELDALAQAYLQQVRRDGGTQNAEPTLGRALRRFGDRYSGIEGVLVRLMVIDGLLSAKELRRRGPTHSGVAVAAEADGKLIVFVLLATAR
jgi:uncharacterized protein YkwD